jgi:hypothetical protein
MLSAAAAANRCVNHYVNKITGSSISGDGTTPALSYHYTHGRLSYIPYVQSQNAHLHLFIAKPTTVRRPWQRNPNFCPPPI